VNIKRYCKLKMLIVDRISKSEWFGYLVIIVTPLIGAIYNELDYAYTLVSVLSYLFMVFSVGVIILSHRAQLKITKSDNKKEAISKLLDIINLRMIEDSNSMILIVSAVLAGILLYCQYYITVGILGVMTISAMYFLNKATATIKS